VFLLTTFAERTCALGEIGMLIVAAIFALLAVVGAPVAVGRVAGGIVARLGKLGHCRSAGVAGKAAVVNGIAVYAGHLLVTLITAGGLQPLIAITTRKLSDDLAIQVTHDNPWWIAVVIVLELLVVIVGAYVEATGRIGDAARESSDGLTPSRSAAKPVRRCAAGTSSTPWFLLPPVPPTVAPLLPVVSLHQSVWSPPRAASGADMLRTLCPQYLCC